MNESLADALKFFRSAAHLSQEALAERAGLSARTISDIETGFAKSPRLISIMLISEALGLTEAERTRLQNAARRKPAHASTHVPSVRRPELVGRDRDVAAVRALFEAEGSRFVTLVGPAGVGKTSLALAVAFDLSGAFEGGVANVELAKVRDPSLVPSAVAQAFGIVESAGASVGEAVIAGLRERQALLVVDNFEHVVAAAPWIADLLAGCPRIALLVTSREPLHLRSERCYAVRPLDVAAAADLFVQRAQAASPGFALSAANRAAVGAIVARLDGLPLAIELAAPRLTLLPPKALAARLERRLPLLGDGPLDLPLRQQTMRGAIAWSFDLLSSDEQALFGRLSALHAGCSLDAAQAAADAAGIGERPFLTVIAALVDKSLLSVEEDEEGEPRFVMLEMLREFGAEKLAESADAVDTQTRIVRYVENLVAEAEPHLNGARQAHWFGRLDRELPTVRLALQWAVDQGKALRALAIASRLWRFWWQRGHWTEGMGWLRRLIALCECESHDDVNLGRGLRALVVLLSAVGEFSQAREPCERAIRLQRACGDERGLAASLTSLGIIMQFQGEFDGAERLHRESLAIRRDLRDEAGVASSLSNIASLAFTREDLDAAETFARESAELYRKIDNLAGLVHALTKLGLVAMARSAYESAERMFEECLQLQRELGISANTLYSWINLGTVALKRGRIDDSLEYHREALTLLTTTPSHVATPAALEGYAAALARAGNPARGARFLGAADALRRKIGLPMYPLELEYYESSVADGRAALGDVAFDTEWQIGANLSADQAVREALAQTVRDSERLRSSLHAPARDRAPLEQAEESFDRDAQRRDHHEAREDAGRL